MDLDFSGRDLQGRSFKNQDLRGANFSGADIRGANFAGADLTGANFRLVRAGLQKQWEIALAIALFALAAFSSFSSGWIGAFIVAILHHLSPSDVVLGLFAVAAISLFFTLAVTRGLMLALAAMGVLFYQKHPTWDVRMMIQMTWLHRLLWGLLSLGGRLNERTLAPLLQWLIDRGKPQLALEVARIFLNWYNVRGVYAAYAQIGDEG